MGSLEGGIGADPPPPASELKGARECSVLWTAKVPDTRPKSLENP